jgi:hypothetical protein
MPFTDVPPSYSSTVSRDAWPLIAPYLPSKVLCAACLVSRRWHGIFIPFLWGDPASHFGIANDAVYVALTRFKKTLRRARPGVRALTHTLHLPPALSEIYGGPYATWLRDVLEWLPSLQSLIVSRLPFFDHHALVALRTTGLPQSETGERWELAPFGLKLLLASSEPNTTSIGLSVAVPRFQNLVYLDLSFTKSARDASVLASLGGLHDIQALKLQGIGMRDGEAEVLANAIGIRVRLLDIRDNHLTDMAVRSLMQACFLPADREQDASRLNTRRVEDWPVGMAPGPDFFSLDLLRSEELDHELLKQLTNPLTGRLAFEDIPHRGLTHLYISGNQLSVEGLSGLLKSQRLHVLDGGTVDTVKTISRSRSLSTASGYVDEVKFPGAEKLVPVLIKAASKNITSLRVDHAIVTAQFEAPIVEKKVYQKRPSAAEMSADDVPTPVAELPGDNSNAVEMGAPSRYAVELPADREPIFELDATPAQPRVELPGDMMFFALSPPVGNKPEDEQKTPQMELQRPEPIRGEGPYAPEVVVSNPNGEEHETVMNGNGAVVSPSHDISSESESGTNSTTRSILSPISPATEHGGHTRYQSMIPPFEPPTRQHTTKQAPQQQPPPLPDLSHMQAPLVPPPRPSSPSPAAIRQSRIDFLLDKRPSPGVLNSLHPSHLPNLRTLTLTNVPLTVPATSSIVARLIEFISACGLESYLSTLLAATDYSLPPGRARHMAEKAAAKRLFALSCVTLEMASPSASDSSKAGGDRAWKHSRQRLSFSKSSTGDMDSENLWSAAADDFSFFAEEGGEERDECGIYEHEKDRYFPSVTAYDDKVVVSPDEALEMERHRTISPRSPHLGETLSPLNALGAGRGGTMAGGTWQSPRQLPMGRNRRPSNEHQARPSSVRSSFDEPGSQRAFTPELPGTMPPPMPPPRPNSSYRQQQVRRPAPTSAPSLHLVSPAPTNGHYNNGNDSPPISPISTPSPPPAPPIDVITALSTFRKTRKAAYEAEMLKFHRFKQGLSIRDRDMLGEGQMLAPFVDGYWKGEIKVVRNAAPKGRSGVVDMYGNYFEKGYLYP